MGGSLTREPGSEVEGDVVTNIPAPNIQIPNVPSPPNVPDVPSPPTPPNFNFDPIGNFLGMLFTAVAVSLLAMLASLFLQPQIERVSQAIVGQPVIAGSIGLLTGVMAPFVLVILAVTIILIPVVILAARGSGTGLVVRPDRHRYGSGRTFHPCHQPDLGAAPDGWIGHLPDDDRGRWYWPDTVHWLVDNGACGSAWYRRCGTDTVRFTTVSSPGCASNAARKRACGINLELSNLKYNEPASAHLAGAGLCLLLLAYFPELLSGKLPS